MKYALQRTIDGNDVYFHYTVPRTGVGFESEDRPIDGELDEETHLWSNRHRAESFANRLKDDGYNGYKVVEVNVLMTINDPKKERLDQAFKTLIDAGPEMVQKAYDNLKASGRI